MDHNSENRRPGRISYPEVRGRRAVDSPFTNLVPGDKNLTAEYSRLSESMYNDHWRPSAAPGHKALETPVW